MITRHDIEDMDEEGVTRESQKYPNPSPLEPKLPESCKNTLETMYAYFTGKKQ